MCKTISGSVIYYVITHHPNTRHYTLDSSLSSELSIELSHHEEQQPYFNLNEDEDIEEEEEELPSYLVQVDKSKR